MTERTVVVFKPDSVERGLVGEILSRFEKAGLRIVGSKTIRVSKEFVGKHYPASKSFLLSVGSKTLENYVKNKRDPKEDFGSNDPVEVGKKIRQWSIEYLSRGPVIAAVLEGNQAVANVRRLVGSTSPADSNPGTIRGDYSTDSFIFANMQKRSIQNLVHASGTPEEAEDEIKLWFKGEELLDVDSE
jgi:nucleoside-diphosphate kinase